MVTPAKVEGKPVWKRVTGHVMWLCMFPPYGLWRLYRDPELTTTAKWRILLYLFVIPTLTYFVLTFWLANQAVEKMIQPQ